VYRAELVEIMARVLCGLGCKRGFVVHGADGMDEVTLTGPTEVGEIRDGSVRLYRVAPEDFGLKRCLLADLQGGDAMTNAEIVREVLGGAPGPRRDVVLLNAAFALTAAGISEDIAAGLERGRQAIDAGAAAEKLAGLVRLTNE
jgi:anthranilate phosphoribosyltransferase